VSLPRPIVAVHGEDVTIEVPGRVVVRAAFLSEGLFDEQAGGEPEEEDLYEVEVTAPEGGLLEPITFALLAPAGSRRFPEEDTDPDDFETALPVERLLMALAWELANAHPENWRAVCTAVRGWDAWTVEDALARLPGDWTPEPLLPED